MTSSTQRELKANIALWGTQGGGLARTAPDGSFVWYELPDWMTELPNGDPHKAKVGDPVPEEWDLIPASTVAREVMLDDSFPPFRWA